MGPKHARAIPPISQQQIAAAIGTFHPPLPSGFRYQVRGALANPYALGWVQLSEDAPQRIAEIVQVNTAGEPTIARPGHTLHPGDQTPNKQPVGSLHHVSISVDGEAIYDVSESPPPPSQADLGNTSTLLKARIFIAMGNSREKVIDFDIAAGVEFAVKAYAITGIDLLVPDPNSIPTLREELPPDFPSETLRVATTLTTAVYCGDGPRGDRCQLRYTQAMTMVETGVDDPRGTTMPVVPAARDVEVFLSEAVDVGDTATVWFVYMLGNPIAPRIGANPMPYTIIGSAQILPGESHLRRVAIPGNANAIMLSASAPTDVVATIVQHLSL